MNCHRPRKASTNQTLDCDRPRKHQLINKWIATFVNDLDKQEPISQWIAALVNDLDKQEPITTSQHISLESLKKILRNILNESILQEYFLCN